MSAGMKGLEERLRQATNFPFGEYAGNNDKPRCPVHVSDLVEAADRIAALEAEVVRLLELAEDQDRRLRRWEPRPVSISGSSILTGNRAALAAGEG